MEGCCTRSVRVSLRRLLLFAFFALLLGLCAELTQAGVDRWTNLGPGGGSVVLALAIDPTVPTTLYAGTSAGVFRSVDSGASWVPARNGLTQPKVQALVIDPKLPGTLYAATPGGIFRSLNAGETWSPANQGLGAGFVTQLRIGAQPQAVLYATVYGRGIYKSVDQATTWSQIEGVGSAWITALAVDLRDGATLYAATSLGGRTDGGLYKSTDGGASWSLGGRGLEEVEVGIIVIDPQSPAVLYAGTQASSGNGTPVETGVFKSIDGGGTWSVASDGLYTRSSGLALVVDPSFPSRLYVQTECCLFKSVDGAKNWSQLTVSPGKPYPSTSIVLEIDPYSARLYAGGYIGLYATADDGASWTPLEHGMEEYSIVSLVSDPSSSSTLYAGSCHPRYADQQPAIHFYPCDVAIFKTIDFGKTWTSVALPGTGDVANVTQSVSVAVVPLAPGTIFAATTAGVFKSIDAGKSFSATCLTRPTRMLAVDPTSASVLFAVADDGVYKSVDSGDAWTRILARADVFSVAVSKSDPSVVYAGAFAEILRSRDGGATWMPTGPLFYLTTVSFLVVDPGSSSIVFAGGQDPSFYVDGSLYRTTDGGDRWDYAMSAVLTAVVVDPIDPATVYAGGAGIFSSFDGGLSWSELGDDLPRVFSLAINPLRSGTLYGGTPRDGVFAVSLLSRSERLPPLVRPLRFQQ